MTSEGEPINNDIANLKRGQRGFNKSHLPRSYDMAFAGIYLLSKSFDPSNYLFRILIFLFLL